MNRLLFCGLLLCSAIAYSQEPDLEKRAKDIARLEKQIDAEIATYNAYPRRYFVGMEPPMEVKGYLAPVFEKIERIGSLNYPPEARGRLYGSVTVEFEIITTGALADVNIVKTSGHEVLDQAALRSVRLAAPFSAFTPEVKQRADILVVIRRFNFEHVELPAGNAL